MIVRRRTVTLKQVKCLFDIFLKLFLYRVERTLLRSQISLLFANSYLEGAHRLHERLNDCADLLSFGLKTIMPCSQLSIHHRLLSLQLPRPSSAIAATARTRLDSLTIL